MSSDPNLNHEAVRFYRDTFRLCPNFGRRKDIVSTVDDVDLWKTLLTEWKEQKWNPLRVNWMLSEYERRAAKQCERSANGNGRTNQRVDEKEAMPLRVSRRRQGHLPDLQEGADLRFRGNSKTLEEIVTEALRQNH